MRFFLTAFVIILLLASSKVSAQQHLTLKKQGSAKLTTLKLKRIRQMVLADSTIVMQVDERSGNLLTTYNWSRQGVYYDDKYSFSTASVMSIEYEAYFNLNNVLFYGGEAIGLAATIFAVNNFNKGNYSNGYIFSGVALIGWGTAAWIYYKPLHESRRRTTYIIGPNAWNLID